MAATNKNMTFDVNLLPTTTGDHNLGSSNLKWNLYVNDFNGNVKANNIIPIMTRTFTSGKYGQDGSGTHYYETLGSITPTTFDKMWLLRYIISIEVSGDSTYTYRSDVSFYGVRNTYGAYKIFNSYYSKYPIYQHALIEGASSSYPHEFGYRLASSYGDTTVIKNIQIDIIEMQNCEVAFFDAPKAYTSTAPTNYTIRTFNATSNGMQETGDDNTITRLYAGNNTMTVGSTFRLAGYSLFGFDKENHVQGISLYNSGYTGNTTTINTARVYNSAGFDWTKGLFYNTGGNYNISTNIYPGIDQSTHAIDFRYTDNCVNSSSLTTLGLERYKPVYFRGTLGTDGLFYLAPLEVTYNNTTYKRAWTQDPSDSNYVYWFLGFPYYNSSYAGGYQLNFYLENKLYQVKNGKLQEYIANAATADAFSSNKTVALTGDVTGTTSSTGGWSISTTLANSGATAGSYGDSSNQTPGYGSTFKVPYVTVDSKGRVTSISEHTVKIPASDNTTYTFENGTNGFKVTPSGGTAQTVTVTPSITNNVTGSGTSGYLAKFNGTHTITNGPQLGSSTTTFLRNDGTWATALTSHQDISGKVNKSGDTMTSSLTITKAGACGVEVNNTQTTNPNQVAFIVGSSGNGGIYSRKHSKWIVYADASGNVVLNGNASTATEFSSGTTVKLTGDVTGESSSSKKGWSIATTIGEGKVTNAMLAGSIANGKLANSSIKIGNKTISLGGTATLADIGVSYPVTGVKGNSESSYRTGNINLTAANIGAVALTGGTMTGALITNASGNSISNIKYHTHTANAGKTYIGWVKIAQFDLPENNNVGNRTLDFYLSRTYNSPSSEAYNIRITIGWGKVNIIQLGGSVGTQIIEKFRVVRDNTNHKIFFEYFVNTSYTTYQNSVNIRILEYFSTNLSLLNEVQTEEDSAFANKWEITLADNKIVSDINGIATNITGTVTIEHGGTNATTASDARTNLGLGSMATKAETDYIMYGGDDPNLGGGSPASTAKTYWADTTKIPDNMIKAYYNHSGAEYSLIFSKRATYGSILKWGYIDTYLRILRIHGGSWKSEDWEKMSAGYADSAGSVALSGVTGADDLKAIEALTGTSGFLKKTAANTWTLDNNTYLTSSTGVTSIAGKTGAIELKDLGLSNAMHFLGVTTTNISTGTANTTATITIGSSNVTAAAGDVVLYGSQEYVWGNSKWNLLGDESSYKVKQTAKSDPTASTSTSTTFIDTISQDANGVITATKKTLPSTIQYANMLTGLSSRSTTMAWGNQTGSVITCMSSSGGGGWGFRDNNPASGQMSMTIDGTIYIKEGAVNVGDAVKSFSVSGKTVTYTTLWGNTGTFTTQDTDTDTKNTAGSTNSTSKLFLIGATSQAANPTTNSYQYTYTNNGLLSALKLGLNLNGTEKAHLEWNDTDQSIDFIFN